MNGRPPPADRPHCLVIGVGAGTGLAYVRRFVAGGYKVSMIARHGDRLQSYADEIENANAYPADISDLDGYRDTLRQIVADHGVPTKVIYNAALATFQPYTELDTALFERNFRVNTTGLLVTAQELAPNMVELGNGALIVTGNTGATRGTPRFVGFSPTKASQRILAESLARRIPSEIVSELVFRGNAGYFVAHEIDTDAICQPWHVRLYRSPTACMATNV